MVREVVHAGQVDGQAARALREAANGMTPTTNGRLDVIVSRQVDRQLDLKRERDTETQRHRDKRPKHHPPSPPCTFTTGRRPSCYTVRVGTHGYDGGLLCLVEEVVGQRRVSIGGIGGQEDLPVSLHVLNKLLQHPNGHRAVAEADNTQQTKQQQASSSLEE